MRHAAGPLPVRSPPRPAGLTALSLWLLGGVAPLGGVALLGCVALLGSCGGAAGDGNLGLGTVSLLNQTDQGEAPLVVEAFFLAPVGEADPGDNLLALAVEPGGVVILGLFPAGTYNAVAILDGGGQINFPPTDVLPGQPTNFVVP